MDVKAAALLELQYAVAAGEGYVLIIARDGHTAIKFSSCDVKKKIACLCSCLVDELRTLPVDLRSDLIKMIEDKAME